MRKFEDLDIEPDEDHGWYIVQCIAGTENNVKAQLEQIVPKTPGAMDFIEKFHVPSRLAGNSHGKKVFMKEQVLYPSYIFIYMMLNDLTYTAIQTVQRVSSFVGPRKLVKGTYGMTQVVPKRLTEKEIETFEGLVEATNVMSQKDQHAFAFEIGEMIVVIDGPYKGETGAVRMVRDGMLVVRFYTYGSQIDTYLDPAVIRKMTEEEMEKGLKGPETPVGQDDIDRALGRPPRRKFGDDRRGGPRDRNDRNDPGLFREGRNRRQDRAGRSQSSRTPYSQEEKENWVEFKDNERRRQVREESKTEKALSSDNDWEIFSKMSAGTSSTSPPASAPSDVDSGGSDDEDAFFADLMKELNESLDEPAGGGGESESKIGGGGGQREDLSKMTVPKLKEMCKGKGLKVGGTKAELLERLQEH